MGTFKRIALDALYNQPTTPLPRFKKGDVICKKQSDTALFYLVTRIQMIGYIPYYHLQGNDGSYRIIPHTFINHWRQITEKERQTPHLTYSFGRDSLRSLFVSPELTRHRSYSQESACLTDDIT
jgi:hypothetical protein